MNPFAFGLAAGSTLLLHPEVEQRGAALWTRTGGQREVKQPEVPKPGGTDSKSTWAKTPPNSLFELLDGLLPTSMAIKGDENKQEVGIIGKKKKTGREQQQGDFPQRYLAEL